MINTSSNATMRDMENEINNTIKSAKTLKSQLFDSCFTIIGLLIIIGLTIWMVVYNQSVSHSISELAPNPDVAKQNIDKIGIFLGIMGVEMAWFWGAFAIGMGFMGVGIAWYSHRSSVRVTIITTNLIGLTTMLVSKQISEEFEKLRKQLTESHTN